MHCTVYFNIHEARSSQRVHLVWVSAPEIDGFQPNHVGSAMPITFTAVSDESDIFKLGKSYRESWGRVPEICTSCRSLTSLSAFQKLQFVNTAGHFRLVARLKSSHVPRLTD
jgi:hypothetical protein